jgi:hypothetical protein
MIFENSCFFLNFHGKYSRLYLCNFQYIFLYVKYITTLMEFLIIISCNVIKQKNICNYSDFKQRQDIEVNDNCRGSRGYKNRKVDTRVNDGSRLKRTRPAIETIREKQDRLSTAK